MTEDWTDGLVTVVYFIVGLGGVAGALLAMTKLWEALVPDRGQQVIRDIASIRTDIHEIRSRVGMLELDMAKIDQPAITRHFDAIERKIDKLHDFLLEHLTQKQS